MLKSRKPTQTLAVPDPVPEPTKGIFGFTEIALHVTEKTSRVSLPRIGSGPTLGSAQTARLTMSQQLFKAATPRKLTQGRNERVTKSQQIIDREKLDQEIQM